MIFVDQAFVVIIIFLIRESLVSFQLTYLGQSEEMGE